MATHNRRARMYRNAGLPSTQPLYLDVRHGTSLYLYLDEQGDWDQESATVARLKARLRKWKFKVSPIRRSITTYGTQDVNCLGFEVSHKEDEDRKLSNKQIAKLRKLTQTWCTAQGTATVTEIYHDKLHLNTQVSITVTDGFVPFTYAPPLKNIEYPLWEGNGAFNFLLATPVGKNAEDPARAATIVAEELSIFLPERVRSRDFKRRVLSEQQFGENFM